MSETTGSVRDPPRRIPQRSKSVDLEALRGRLQINPELTMYQEVEDRGRPLEDPRTLSVNTMTDFVHTIVTGDLLNQDYELTTEAVLSLGLTESAADDMSRFFESIRLILYFIECCKLFRATLKGDRLVIWNRMIDTAECRASRIFRQFIDLWEFDSTEFTKHLLSGDISLAIVHTKMLMSSSFDSRSELWKKSVANAGQVVVHRELLENKGAPAKLTYDNMANPTQVLKVEPYVVRTHD